MLVLKLLAIGAFLGGPLVLLDRWQPWPDELYGFLLAFLPCALLLFGALSFADESGWFRRLALAGGHVGAALLLAQNAWAVWLASQPNEGIELTPLELGGICVGVSTALWYVYLGQRTPPAFDLERELTRMRWRAVLRDYALLAISLGFVAAGLLLMQSDRDAAIYTTVFFGGCGVLPVLNIRRRWRLARARDQGALPTIVLPDDNTLRQQPGRVVLVLLALLLGTLLLVWFGSGAPLFVRVMIGLVACAAALGLLLVALGKLPIGFVRFDADGLTLGRRGFVMHVPWQAIVEVGVSDYFDNPVVLVGLSEPDSVHTTPREHRARALREIARSQSWGFASLSIMTTHYGVDAGALARAIEAHVLAHSQRAAPADD